MPWDGPDWMVGLQSLHSLVEFELRTWFFLRETPTAENVLIYPWLTFGPGSLRRVVIISGVLQNWGRKIVCEKVDVDLELGFAFI